METYTVMMYVVSIFFCLWVLVGAGIGLFALWKWWTKRRMEKIIEEQGLEEKYKDVYEKKEEPKEKFTGETVTIEEPTEEVKNVTQ